MTVYYVNFAQADDTGDGFTSWATAKKLLQSALTLATTSGDVILWHKDSAETVAADTTLAASANISIISVNKDASDAPTPGATIGAQATNYSMNFFTGAFKIYVYGVTFKTGTNTSSTKGMNINHSDGQNLELESCEIQLYAASTGWMTFGGTTAANNTYTKLNNCSLRFSNTAQGIQVQAAIVDIIGTTVASDGQQPAATFKAAANANNFRVMATGCDFSHGGGTSVIAASTGNGLGQFQFSNCKIGTGTIFAPDTSVAGKGTTSALLLNCSTGDTHYDFYHHDAFGSTIASATIYANDGAKYDGTNGVAWNVTTTANCSFYTPYVSPWIDKYHSGTSAITPSLEGLWINATGGAVIENDEVWGEFSFQGTSGSTKATINGTSRMALLGSPADQTSAKAFGDWTASPATDSGDTTFKLAPAAAVTPAEIGHLRARVVVGQPEITVYVDPTIRT